MTRRRLFPKTLLACAALMAGTAFAQSAAPWPSKPVKIVVPYGSGSSPDVIARIADHPISKIDEMLPWAWAENPPQTAAA